MLLQNGVLEFRSGPELNGGTGLHRKDGFTAWYRGIPVVAGKRHLLQVDIVLLDGHTDLGMGTKGTEDYLPTWIIYVFDSADAGTPPPVSGTWSTAQCTSCPGVASDYGPKPVSFTPAGSTVDVAISASLASSQCSAEVYGIEVGIDGMTVQAQ
jgi:hypothetical protein